MIQCIARSLPVLLPLQSMAVLLIFDLMLRSQIICFAFVRGVFNEALLERVYEPRILNERWFMG